VNESVQTILSQTGRLDVIVRNCGHMVHGPLEGFTPEQLAQQYGVNVLSTQRLNRARIAAHAQAAVGLASLGEQFKRARRKPTAPGTLLRRKGWDGCIGHVVLVGAQSMGH
jgi:NAD(P)-dependent dehydrogenase (short-subunit alcohol dehydrogenase family)